jgi:hypothetical protein
MKAHISSFFLAFGFSCAAALTVAGSIRAQAPPGPLPGAQPQPSPSSTANPQNQQTRAETRTSIFGQWKLNRDESDDPRKKMEDARGNSGGGRSGGGGGGVRIGGLPIGGHGGNRGGESGVDRERMQSVIAPANSLTLAQKSAKDPEVDLTDDQNRKRALFTDGRKLQKPDSKDDSYQEIAAHWDGSRVVTDEKSPRGGKMSRTFELSYDGTQLFETLRLTTGRSNTPLDVRYVYDAVSSSGTPPNQ